MDWNTLTVGEALRSTARRFPNRTALIGMDRRVSFAELDKIADEIAYGLRALGVARGSQVALWMTNCPEWVACWMGCTRIGAVVVPINTRFRAEEVAYILRKSDARVLIAMDRFWNSDFLGVIHGLVHELRGAIPGRLRSARFPELRTVVLWGAVESPGTTNLEAVRHEGARRLAAGDTLQPADPKDPVIIVYTSGTTGHPKGAMHGHIVMRNAANIARVMHIEPGDVILGHMPFYHVAGALGACIPAILQGCTLVTVPHWVPDEALDTIERERVTIFGGIPTHFIDCLDAIRRRPRDLSCLKSAWIGGAPVTPDVAQAAKRELGLKALQVVYGMTETTAATVFSEFDAPIEIVCENKGRPIGEFEVAVCDPDGKPVPAREVGEVRVRGHVVMQGYYKDPKATAEAITHDGWFRTGDLGVFDEAGYLKITGRLKDMFIVGGSNAYPAEIEGVLQGMPKVKQAVVVGVPDRRLGEVGYAFVQVHEGVRLDLDELLRYCKNMMADYKVPRYVRFVDDFPRTTTGKIERYVLQQQAREQLAVG